MSRPTISTTETLAALEDALENFFRRLRRHHQPRSHVPRPPRHPHCFPSRAIATSNGSKAIFDDYEAEQDPSPGTGQRQPEAGDV